MIVDGVSDERLAELGLNSRSVAIGKVGLPSQNGISILYDMTYCADEKYRAIRHNPPAGGFGLAGIVPEGAPILFDKDFNATKR